MSELFFESSLSTEIFGKKLLTSSCLGDSIAKYARALSFGVMPPLRLPFRPWLRHRVSNYKKGDNLL